jgi:DNA (cytosine-5)-methyltransferase 1
LKFYDLFSGIGGFRLGLERCGFTCVGSCEIDKYAREVYRKNFGDYPTESDIRQVDPSTQIQDFDILTAGFPCQAFSVAGKRMGFDDTRGTLFFEIARIAATKRPKILFLENVKGLLNHDRGRTFGTIINTLYELGYDVEWQVINGKYFVPQNRERVFIIGHLREKPTPKIFPIKEITKEFTKTCRVTQTERQRIWDEYTKCLRAGEGTNSRQYVRTIDSNYWKGGGTRTMIFSAHTKATIKQRIQDRHQSWSLDTTGNNQLVVEEDKDSSVRKLTPLECERLMGFPDNWTQGQSDTQRYKMLGNAVIPQIIEMIGNKL